jgi:hypothetical protein
VLLLCDNRNLSHITVSLDARVARWQERIRAWGAAIVQRGWIPGDWNTIADYGSRVVNPDREALLSPDEELEARVDAIIAPAAPPPPASSSPSPQAAPASAPKRTRRRHGKATKDTTLTAAAGGTGVSEPLPEQPALPPPALHAVAGGAGTDVPLPVVPGHISIAPLLAEIAVAQAAAPDSERRTWTGTGYANIVLAGHAITFYRSKAVVPAAAVAIRARLLREAHELQYHMGAGDRTQHQLQRSGHVWWSTIGDDASRHVATCTRCTLAKDVDPPKYGSLVPTLAPHPFHTWYMDFKGPGPNGTGYLLAVVCPLTRFVRLRWVPNANTKELLEELDEVVTINASLPAVIRCDNGAPFNSTEFAAWCADRNITLVHGVPHHSQGQGSVETKFRPIAHALMATLGKKAAADWKVHPHIQRLEFIINTMYCEPIGGSPYFAVFGREPRTPLAAKTSWTDSAVARFLETATISAEDVQNIIGEHHARITAVQSLLLTGSSVAQAVTKAAYEKLAKPSPFTVGSSVALHTAPPNKLSHRYSGPYVITALTSGGNIATITSLASQYSANQPALHVRGLRA